MDLIYSLSRDAASYSIFETKQANIDEFLKDIQSSMWSPSVYTNNQRAIKNFKSSQILAYDIDGGWPEEAAKDLLNTSNLSYILAATRNHQKEKNGVVADRFRLILFLDHPITDPTHYKQVLLEAADSHGFIDFIDRAAIDAARMFYPSPKILDGVSGLNLIHVSSYPKRVKPIYTPKQTAESALHGDLAKHTLNFLTFGAEPGSRHHNLVKATLDLKQNNYSYDEALDMLERGAMPLDEHAYAQIEDVYSNREVKHPPRIPESLSNLAVTPSSLFSEMQEYLENVDKVQGIPTGLPGLDKLLGGGFRQGQVEVLLAQAKTGKSSLFHQIIYNMIERGDKVGYASRELNPATEVLPNLLSIRNKTNMWLSPETLGQSKEAVADWDSRLFFAKGYGFIPSNHIQDWIKELKNRAGVQIFFFDHLHWMLEDPEEFKDASKLAMSLKHFAKEFDVSIVLIVQPTKIHPDQRLGLNTLRGGAAIGQAIDTLLTLERHKCASPNISKLSLTDARHKLARPGTIYLHYDPDTTIITEAEPEAEAPEAEYDQEEPQSIIKLL